MWLETPAADDQLGSDWLLGKLHILQERWSLIYSHFISEFWSQWAF